MMLHRVRLRPPLIYGSHRTIQTVEELQKEADAVAEYKVELQKLCERAGHNRDQDKETGAVETGKEAAATGRELPSSNNNREDHLSDQRRLVDNCWPRVASWFL